MPRFAANLTFLFAELPFEARFKAAADAGFTAVEMLRPYDHPPTVLRDLIEEAGLELALFNTPVHDWDDGGRGVAAIAGEESRFRDEFELALAYAEVLAPRHIHIMSGLAAGAAAQECYVANLEWCARHAPGQSLTIEPINPHDTPGYFLNDLPQAMTILAQVDAANLRLQFDAYHLHRLHGDVAAQWRQVRDHVAHVQVAGVPGRHEPLGGEIDYPGFFAMLDADGYDGFVSGEYMPLGRTGEGLGWIRGHA